MTGLFQSLFPSTKRRKTESTSDGASTSAGPSTSSSLPGSSSTMSLSALQEAGPSTSTAFYGHRRQHSTGQMSAGLPPLMPRPSRRRADSQLNVVEGFPLPKVPVSNLCKHSTVTIKPEDFRLILIETESRVLYDTATVIPVKDDVPTLTKNLSKCKQFQYLKKRKDTIRFAEMIFGAAPSLKPSESIKIHVVEDLEKVLLSRTFFIPKNSKNDPNFLSSDSDSQSTLKSVEGWGPRAFKSTTSTPEAFNRIRHISINNDDDSDLNFAPGSSASSYAAPRAFSPPHRLSKNRRRQMAVKTSLSETTAIPIPSSLRARSRFNSISSQTDDESTPARENRHVAMGLLFPQSREVFIMQHIPIIEAEMSRLEGKVAQAAQNPSTFLATIWKAWMEFTDTICRLHNAPRLVDPVWLTLNEKPNDREKIVASNFVEQLTNLIKKYDTKESGYFFSNLVTAILMHHMSWVASVANQPIQNYLKSEMKEKYELFGTCQNDDAATYNAQMAQYLELSGNCGTFRSAKVVMMGDDVESMSQVIHVLSYFIRCSAVQQVDNEECWQVPVDEAFSPVCMSTAEPSEIAGSPPNEGCCFSMDEPMNVDEHHFVEPEPVTFVEPVVKEIVLDENGIPISDLRLSRRARRAEKRAAKKLLKEEEENGVVREKEELELVQTTEIVVHEPRGVSTFTLIDRFSLESCSYDLKTSEFWAPKPSSPGIARSLFSGPVPYYCPHFVVTGIVKDKANMTEVTSRMYDEVRSIDSPCHRAVASSLSSSQSSSSVCDVQFPENVLIIGDINELTVKVMSSEGVDEVASPSEAVVRMMEQFVGLQSTKTLPEEFLLSLLEDNLGQMVGRSTSLVELVKCEEGNAVEGKPNQPDEEQGSSSSSSAAAPLALSPDRVRNIVDCDHSDLRLIVNVASVYWPPVLASVLG